MCLPAGVAHREFLPIPITSRLRLLRATPAPTGRPILVFLSLYFSFFSYPALVSHMPQLHGSLIGKNRGSLCEVINAVLESEAANEFNARGANPLLK